MKLIKLMLFVCILSVTALAQNNQKTLEKPFDKWSKEEAMKLISSKPFAEEFQSPIGSAGATQTQQMREQIDTNISGNNRGRGAVISAPAPIVVRLHSGLPVRQAMVRLRQIQAGYDKMKDEDRKKFDETQKVLLDCPICKDYYVVTVTKFKDKSEAVDDGIFQTMKLEDFKGKVWLINEKDEKRELEQFTPPKMAGDSAVFYFKRMDDNSNLLLTTENKELKFVFSNELLRNNAYSYLLQRVFEFKVSKIIIDNRVEF